MVKLSYSIMAHPSRERLVHNLRRRLGADTPVAWDQIGDRWDTGRRALLAHVNAGSDRALVLQDDAVLPRGFIPGVRNALEHVPEDSPLVLFCTRTKHWSPVLNQVPADASFLVMDFIYWGPGIVVPTYMIPEIVEWCDGLDTPQYDHRLGEWFRHLGVDCLYTWPNLVDHMHVPSLISGRSSRRSAHNFVRGRADRLDWSGLKVRVVAPDTLPEPRG